MAWLILPLLACSEPEPVEEAAAAPEPAEASAPAPDRPNVLVILWDTVRADLTSLHGHARDTTPHLARWARHGVVHDRAISPGVWTLPSHASLFTGLAVSEHGVGDRRKWLDDGFVTLAERLRDAGWDTFAWSSNPFVSRKTNLLQGFDHVAHPWVPPWSQVARRVADEERIAEASTAGEAGDDPWALSATGDVAERALLRWLDRRDDDGPWLAFVNLLEAHATRSPPLEARARVMDEAMARRSLELDQSQRRLVDVMAGRVVLSPEDAEIARRVYEATLVDLDRITWHLLQALRERGELEDAVVVLTSDHGELLGEHGMYGHQLAVWRELTHVPLVVVAPGRLEPRRVAEPTSTAEVHDLVLRLAGVAGGGVAEARRGHGAVTEYLEPMASSVKMLRGREGRALPAAWVQAQVALEHGERKVVRGERTGMVVYDVVADPREGLPVTDDGGTSGRLAAWEGTLRRYEHEGAEPVTGIEEDAEARGALRALGYVE